MTVWILTVVLGFPPDDSGLPFVSEHKCKQAAAEAAFTVKGEQYYCREVLRTEEHNLFFIELAQSKKKLAHARAKRQQQRVIKALYEVW